MIKHIVMFRLKDKDGKTALENALIAKEQADRLTGLVPSLRHLETVINSEEADSTNFHIALICDFDSIEGLNAYQNHPEHKKFGAFISTLREDGSSRACIDYEY